MRTHVPAILPRLLTAVAALLAATALEPGVARAQSEVVAAQAASPVPFNLGLVPYVDVNSHFVRPRNNLSIDGVAGCAWGLEGLGISGVAGVLRGTARGLAVTGVAEVVGDDFAGAQIAGVTGVVGGDFAGAQIAGLLNVTGGSVRGLQLAGIVNHADAVSGAQIGLINIGGRVKGLQLGLINIADEVDGAPVGLVSVVRKGGRHQVDVTSGNTAPFWVGTHLGGKYVYSILGLGLGRAQDEVTWMPTVGLGGSVPILERGFLSLELLGSAVNYGAEFDEETLLGQLRLVGGARLGWLTIFAGPVLDSLRSSNGKRLSDISYVPTLATFESSGTRTDLDLGFVVGIQAL